MSPPFRAEHVGSLLRPAKLLKARAERAAGRRDAAGLRAIEDEAVREAVRMQEEVGLEAVTDGELRRRSWHMDFYQQIGGLAPAGHQVTVPFHNERGAVPFVVEGVRMEGRLGLPKTIFAEDFAFLKAATKATPKLTIPSPSVLHRRGGQLIDQRLYPDPAQFWTDLSAVYAAEIAGLAKLGCTYLQIDDTSFATLCDPEQRRQMSAAGHDGDRLHLTYLKLVNDALAKKPAGMTVVTHTCRGNFRSGWFAAGGYEFIAEALFGGLEVDGFFLEYDDERSGDFAPLRFLPKDKFAVLGLVTSKRAALESKDALKRRIDQAAKYAPLDRLCLSPQCGFSSTVEGNELTPEEQRAKLHLVVETAREVWG